MRVTLAAQERGESISKPDFEAKARAFFQLGLRPL